jgi:glutamate-1-semialdehyde aminotransferase
MKIIETENESLYSRLYAIGRRLTNSFNDQAEDLGVSARAVGLPIENPTTFSVNLFNRPVPPEMDYLWESGPSTFEDYDSKASFNAGSRAGYAFYLSMMNSGINAFHGRSFITCTKYYEEDLKRTETAFGTALKVLKENKRVGIDK